MDTYANSRDPDEMLRSDEMSLSAEFHQGLHCLVTKTIFRERNSTIFGNCNL